VAGRFPVLTDACVNDHFVRRFRGIVAWPVETYEHRSIGDLALDFEALAKEQDPFAYPVRHLKNR
jgi:hypothetical protein